MNVGIILALALSSSPADLPPTQTATASKDALFKLAVNGTRQAALMRVQRDAARRTAEQAAGSLAKCQDRALDLAAAVDDRARDQAIQAERLDRAEARNEVLLYVSIGLGVLLVGTAAAAGLTAAK